MSNIAHFSINADDVTRRAIFTKMSSGGSLNRWVLATFIESTPAKPRTNMACIRSILGGN